VSERREAGAINEWASMNRRRRAGRAQSGSARISGLTGSCHSGKTFERNGVRNDVIRGLPTASRNQRNAFKTDDRRHTYIAAVNVFHDRDVPTKL